MEAIFVLDKEIAECILTRREKEYLCLVAMGFRNHEIAKILFVSRSTVKKELESIFIKLSSRNRANAVAVAFIHKILNNTLLSEVFQQYNLQEHPIFKDSKKADKKKLDAFRKLY